MKSIKGKLVSSSNHVMAKYLGKVVTLNQITHGDKHVQVSQERNGKTIVIVISYKEDIYEIEKQSQKFIYA